jgi:hypothetical protein
VHVSWENPPGGLHPKIAFYLEHFIEVRDGLIIQPPYTSHHWAHSLHIPLGKLWVERKDDTYKKKYVESNVMI